MLQKYLFILLLLICPAVSMQATDAQEAASQLVGLGLENVRVATKGTETVYVAIEAASYRETYRGAAVCLQKLGELFPEVGTFRVMLIENQMPQMALTATRENGRWKLKGGYDYHDIDIATRVTTVRNSSSGKMDLTVYPMVTLINHRLNQVFEYVVSLAPTFETSLWKGNRITLQAVIPVSYDTESINNETYPHVGIADVAQEITSPNGRWQAALAGGFFFFDRYGVDLRLGYHVTPRLTLGAEASCTGDAFVDYDGHYNFGKMKRFSYFGKVDYYEPYTLLQGQITGGRFVYGDYGVRGDISRHFGDYTIGVYGIWSEGETNLGFHFAIPIGPKRQMRKGMLRLRMPHYFDWEYSMDSDDLKGDFYAKNKGGVVETRPDENRSAHYWQPVHVAQYAEKILNGDLK